MYVALINIYRRNNNSNIRCHVSDNEEYSISAVYFIFNLYYNYKYIIFCIKHLFKDTDVFQEKNLKRDGDYCSKLD